MHQIQMETATSVQAAIDAELRRKPDARIIIISDALLTLPVIKAE